ncbi:VWA domain-containing protein [Verminephrobacter aporrectodeae subsp. tuberculatae]|uniref:vWA domain-containing protein n=1 Tax=Verminephrobacter aporrectodeae TaxID=1110389 RepID=UPI002237EC2A|nr:VWA domain-containing protein [Verminephrobacter aporrectodeae]MCW5255760.1 VWA domain-containing protein [Verminephrobacter aporrectodeae subsp. tuberculatae]
MASISPSPALTPWGDARSGKLADNLSGFGRALRRAGVPVDAARMALAQRALLLVGLRRDDFGAALEAVLLSREQDRMLFRELFDAYFRNPELAQRLLAQMLPGAESRAARAQRRPRVSEALAPVHAARSGAREEEKLQFDAAMTASALRRLRQADFNQLSASEYLLAERLARDIPLPLPHYAARRLRPGVRGSRPHWPGAMQHAVRSGGELLQLPLLQRRRQPLPLLVLVDVSGSMERYARLLLAFLHAATAPRHARCAGGAALRRDVFAFGTGLSDLTPAFRLTDTDAMLLAANQAIADFAGGTRIGESLARLRLRHARHLVGRRTLVLLISDGLDTGAPEALAQELGWLRRHCGRLLWLNPLLRFAGYAPTARGAAELQRQAHGVLAVHNLGCLQDLAASLASLLRQ